MTTPSSKPQRVPPDSETRFRIRETARQIVAEARLVPPLTLSQLRQQAERLLDRLSLVDAGYDHYAIIMLNNALWETVFSAFPHDQRLLLLPICLRNHDRCKAPHDDMGLLCQDCGACRIPAFTEAAESHGIQVLVSESSSCVSEWVEQGMIQAVIGVSCLESMEKTFPAMFRNGIPGICVPLLAGGCRDTVTDTKFLLEALSIPETEFLPLPAFHDLREPVNQLFQAEPLNRHLELEGACAARFPTDAILWLLTQGRHYRPLLAAAIFLVLSRQTALPAFLEPILLAIECFHKASLVHDDIEDADPLRYGEPTLHKKIGEAAALNAGDFLLGEGYRLLARADLSADQRVAMLAEAARAHRELTLGQSLEFETANEPRTLKTCLAIDKLKTVPAFRVALLIGAIAAGRLQEHQALLEAFSEAFGIAFQLRDDLDDEAPNPASAVDCVMHSRSVPRDDARRIVTECYLDYRSRAYSTLEPLADPALKILLYRLIGKVLNDV